MLFWLSSVIVLLSALCAAPVQAEMRPIALVYHGEGVCAGCPESLSLSLKTAGFDAQDVQPGEIIARLKTAAVFAVPGGEEERDVKKAFQRGELEAIQNFVQKGGRYLGVCLGGYLADEFLPDDLKIPGLHLYDGFVTPHSPTTKKAKVEKITWKDGSLHDSYFQDGPEFNLPENSPAEIWARYDDQKVAALQEVKGEGKVGLIGMHLEADASWFQEDHLKTPGKRAYFVETQALFTEFMNALLK